MEGGRRAGIEKQSASLRKRRRAQATLKSLRKRLGALPRLVRDGRPPGAAGFGRDDRALLHFSAVHKLSTLQRRVSGISQAHQAAGYASPVGPGARAILEGVARARGARPVQKAALTPAQLLEICRQLDPLQNVIFL